MPSSFIRQRRHFLLAGSALAFAGISPARALQSQADTPADRLAALEARLGGRLGVAAIDSGSGRRILHRADERFPVCSTFKAIAAAAILARSSAEPGLLDRRMTYTASDLVRWSPVTEKHVDTGMSVAALCAAALQYSDNTAGNLLMRLLGGPAAVTDYARRLGNASFRLDRWETELNTAIPGDPRDTATPADMAASLQALLLGDALAEAQRTQLKTWLLGNTTGAKRIRAGMPAGWTVADKTGSGDYGAANDIAVCWPPAGAPIVLAIYHTHTAPKAKWNDAIHAETARIVVESLA